MSTWNAHMNDLDPPKQGPYEVYKYNKEQNKPEPKPAHPILDDYQEEEDTDPAIDSASIGAIVLNKAFEEADADDFEDSFGNRYL